jgi:hypothetical protein
LNKASVPQTKGSHSLGMIMPKVRIHNQNMTHAASAHADRNTFGHLS